MAIVLTENSLWRAVFPDEVLGRIPLEIQEPAMALVSSETGTKIHSVLDRLAHAHAPAIW